MCMVSERTVGAALRGRPCLITAGRGTIFATGNLARALTNPVKFSRIITVALVENLTV